MVVALATQHSKQDVIAPPFLRTLESVVVVPSAIDTDALGTFTGEIPRHGTPTEVCERKARLGLAATGRVLAVASEGSYGPHPAVPFVAVGREVMVFVDTERDLTITETLRDSRHELHRRTLRFPHGRRGIVASSGQIPSHGVIVRPNAPPTDGSSRGRACKRITSCQPPYRWPPANPRTVSRGLNQICGRT